MDIVDEREKFDNNIVGQQYICLRILRIVDKICKKCGIEYWISDGTLLGAIRNKKFIPWDDDIDICVSSKDKEKLKEKLKEMLPYDLYLEENSINTDFFKIRDRYSYAKELENSDIKQDGIWVDIFIMNEIQENIFIQKILKKLPSSIDKKNDIFMVKVIRRIIKYVKNYYYIKLTSSVKKEEKKNSYIYMNGDPWWHTYKKEWIFPLKEIEFEGYKFNGPNNPNKYLESYYGKDYIKLPVENKRITHTQEVYLFNSKSHSESLKWSERENYLRHISKRENNEK